MDKSNDGEVKFQVNQVVIPMKVNIYSLTLSQLFTKCTGIIKSRLMSLRAHKKFQISVADVANVDKVEV